jgi:hypothetical protein
MFSLSLGFYNFHCVGYTSVLVARFQDMTRITSVTVVIFYISYMLFVSGIEWSASLPYVLQKKENNKVQQFSSMSAF